MEYDHTKETEEIRSNIYKRMSPQEKLEASFALYRTAWELKRAGIKKLHPELSDEEIEKKVREIFLYAKS